MSKEKIEWSSLIKSLYSIMDYEEIFVKEQKSGDEMHIYLTDKTGIKIIILKKDGTWRWIKDEEAKK